jgi:hypothetical protein
MAGPPGLARQRSVEYAKKNNHVSNTICGIVFMAPSIAGLVIASNYDSATNVCNDGTKYSVDLDMFLYVGGGLQLGVFFLNCMLILCTRILCSDYMDAVAQNKLSSLPGFFLLAWAIIGLVMYANQMSAACQDTQIGTMIFAWSLIIVCMFGLVCCCAFCVICIAGMAAANGQ